MELGKQFGTLFCSEAAANLHLDFGMAQVAFCLVIVEGHIKGTEEQADFFLQTCHTLNEGICLSSGFSSPFLLLLLNGRVLVSPHADQEIVKAHILFQVISPS